MNPSDLQVEIRARTVGQTVAMATRLLQERKGPILIAWMLYSLPLLALSQGLLLGSVLDPGWIWFFLFALVPAFSLPMVVTVGHLVFSPTVSFATVLSTSLRRFVGHFVLLVFFRIATLMASFIFIVPSYYVWRMGWFLGPIAALEGSGLNGSFLRSRAFATGFQGFAMVHALNALALLLYGTVAIAAVLHFFIRYVIGLNVTIVGDLLRYEHYYSLVGLSAFCLVVPFVTLYWFFVYLEVRTRKEGWDLEIAFRARAQQLERQAHG